MSQKLAQTAGDLANEVFGVRPASVEKISLGVMTFKFAIKLPNDESYILRFYPRSRENVVTYEPDLMRRCHKAGIGTPEVVIDSRKGPHAEMKYVVYRMIQGTQLAQRLSSLSSEALERIARDIGNRMEKLAEIPVAGYGDLITADRGRFDSFAGFIARSFAEGLEVAEQHRLWPSETIESLREIASASGMRAQGNRVELAWGDLSAENIVVHPNNEVAGLVDFEGVIAANRLLNLGYAFAGYNRSAFFDALARNWPEPLDETRWHSIHFYCILRAVRLARFTGEPLPTGHPRTTIEDLLPGFLPAIEWLSKK